MIFYKSKKWKKLLERKQMILIPVEEYKDLIYKKIKCQEFENRERGILDKIIKKVNDGELTVAEGRTVLKLLKYLD